MLNFREDAFAHHVTGVAALVQAAGPEQFKTDFEINMLKAQSSALVRFFL